MGPRWLVEVLVCIHMPFGAGARLEITSELTHERMFFYYYIDYEELDEFEDGIGRFHAQWRRSNPCPGAELASESNDEFLLTGTNLDGNANHTILDAAGRGHYVGCLITSA